MITEPSPVLRGRRQSWGQSDHPDRDAERAIPVFAREDDRLPVKGPAVGLFADQEIRLLRGPLFVVEDYDIEREVVALSGSRRTESVWVKTRVFDKTNSRGGDHAAEHGDAEGIPTRRMRKNIDGCTEILPAKSELRCRSSFEQMHVAKSPHSE